MDLSRIIINKVASQMLASVELNKKINNLSISKLSKDVIEVSKTHLKNELHSYLVCIKINNKILQRIMEIERVLLEDNGQNIHQDLECILSKPEFIEDKNNGTNEDLKKEEIQTQEPKEPESCSFDSSECQDSVCKDNVSSEDSQSFHLEINSQKVNTETESSPNSIDNERNDNIKVKDEALNILNNIYEENNIDPCDDASISSGTDDDIWVDDSGRFATYEIGWNNEGEIDDELSDTDEEEEFEHEKINELREEDKTTEIFVFETKYSEPGSSDEIKTKLIKTLSQICEKYVHKESLDVLTYIQSWTENISSDHNEITKIDIIADVCRKNECLLYDFIDEKISRAVEMKKYVDDERTEFPNKSINQVFMGSRYKKSHKELCILWCDLCTGKKVFEKFVTYFLGDIVPPALNSRPKELSLPLPLKKYLTVKTQSLESRVQRLGIENRIYEMGFVGEVINDIITTQIFSELRDEEPKIISLRDHKVVNSSNNSNLQM